MAETRPGALHVTDLGRGESIVLVHGSFEWGEKTWSEQRPLAADFRRRLVDRRGFGRSPPGGRVDFARDADDIAALLDGGARLVGHSYGGIGCLLAAARRPDAVRSLTVIEPPALGLVRGQGAVEEIIERVRVSRDRARSAAEVAMLFRVAFGYPPQEAEIPLARLRAAAIPTLVVRGTRCEAPPDAQRVTARAVHAACDVLERELDAEAAVFDGSAHSPQTLGAPFNDRLRAFLAGG